MRAISTGGGMKEMVDIDGFADSMFGDCFETLLWVDGRGGDVLTALEAGFAADEILLHQVDRRQLVEVKAAQFVSDDILSAIPGIQSSERLHPALPLMTRKDTTVPFRSCVEMLGQDAGRLLDGGALNWIILYVTSLMEVKSSMGVIVAAPTAGACAALSITPTAQAPDAKLGARREASCVTGCGCG